MVLVQRIICILCMSIFISACQSGTESDGFISLKSENMLENQTVSYLDFSETDVSIQTQAEQMYLALSAELYNSFEDSKNSAIFYQKLVADSRDLALVKRATILAAGTDQTENALLDAQQWVKLSPLSLESNQYLALLLLRLDKYKQSAIQLRKIKQIVENNASMGEVKSNKSLRFIGALLSVESHHKKALHAFQSYIKIFSGEVADDKTRAQQQLILASLANQAKNFDVVVSSLSRLDAYAEQHFIAPKSYIKATLMKAKALKSIKQVSDAVNILKPVVDENEVSDSIKLELVRLLIMDQQKDKASIYLKALTVKHPQNNDLLKSLIALEIDQLQFSEALNNIYKLKRSRDYINDAEYFMAEVLEAQGDAKSALKSYLKVKSGSLLVNAKKKILRLNKQLANKKVKSNPSSPRKVNYKKTLLESYIE